MIIKKLAVPLINDKILPQAEHCYIATTSISESAFDFVKSRLSPKCKIEIVTGLDALTSPNVLKKNMEKLPGEDHTENLYKKFFNANVYIFDLPFRKSVAFIGSGQFTLEGIKDNEEIFYKITDLKEIEALKSWFTGYYEFSEPLTENILQEYELIYPYLRQREIASREEKQQVIELTTRGFNWDAIRFKNQFFNKEDYLTFSNAKASMNSPEMQTERVNVQNKLSSLHQLITEHMADLGLYENAFNNSGISSVNPRDHPDEKIRAMGISYGRSKTELARYYAGAKPDNFIHLLIIILQKEVGIWLVIGNPKGSREDREYFRKQMEEVDYRNTFLKMVQALGVGYWVEVAGEKKDVNTFQTEDSLWEFIKPDDWRYYTFKFGKNFTPGDPEISSANIAATIAKESDKLALIYRHLKEKAV